ncbi:MAG: hypothetical protein ACXVWF_00370 [Actinomycetota bacterium]
MGIVGGGQPHIPGPTLAGVGKGRFGRSRRIAILERYDGAVWREVGRYGSVRDADVALDEAIGAGGGPGTMRVVEVGLSTTARVLVIVAAVALAVAVAFVLYVLLG